MKTARIYAIAEPGVHVKFGVSADVDERFGQMQVHYPHELRLLATSDQMPKSEAHALEWLIHRALFRHHVRGEWFRSCPATLAAANHLATMPVAALVEFYTQRATDELRIALKNFRIPSHVSRLIGIAGKRRRRTP